MDIDVSCESCNDELEKEKEYSERGDIRITVHPCEFCTGELKEVIKELADEYLPHGNDDYFGISPRQRRLAAKVNKILS